MIRVRWGKLQRLVKWYKENKRKAENLYTPGAGSPQTFEYGDAVVAYQRIECLIRSFCRASCLCDDKVMVMANSLAK